MAVVAFDHLVEIALRPPVDYGPDGAFNKGWVRTTQPVNNGLALVMHAIDDSMAAWRRCSWEMKLSWGDRYSFILRVQLERPREDIWAESDRGSSMRPVAAVKSALVERRYGAMRISNGWVAGRDFLTVNYPKINWCHSGEGLRKYR